MSIPGASDVYLQRERAGEPWRIVAVVHRDAAQVEWRAEFRDFQNDLPRTIRIGSADRRRFDLTLALSQVDINAPLGALGIGTLKGISTTALKSDDATYAALTAQIKSITTKRNDIAGQMITMLEDAAFNNKPVDEAAATSLTKQANDLLDSVP